MADQNSKLVEEAFERFAPKMREIIAKHFEPTCIGAVEEAYNARTWMGFTGQAQNSFASYQLKNGSVQLVFDSSQMAPEPVRYKVEEGEILYLSNPVEGRPRSVGGIPEIRFSESEDAIRAIRSFPFKNQSKLAGAMRFAFPVEYDNLIYGEKIGEVDGMAMLYALVTAMLPKS